MTSLSRVIRYGASPLIISFVTALVSWAEENRFAGLLANSPFGSGAVAIVVAEPALEFRGYVYTDETALFSMACPDASGRLRSAWVEIDEPNADYVVRSFDRASDTVDVEHRGHRFTLKLKLSRVQLLPAPERSPAGGDQAAVADEKTRLETISAEIRRRRALRQANAQNHDSAQP